MTYSSRICAHTIHILIQTVALTSHVRIQVAETVNIHQNSVPTVGIRAARPAKIAINAAYCTQKIKSHIK